MSISKQIKSLVENAKLCPVPMIFYLFKKPFDSHDQWFLHSDISGHRRAAAGKS